MKVIQNEEMIEFQIKKIVYNIQKIYLLAPIPKGSKLIFFTPFREGANEENQVLTKLKSY